MPWVDRLYLVTYQSIPGAGAGAGLYAIDDNMQMTRLATHNSAFTNRMMHVATQSIIIGPWVIDMNGNIRVITDLLHVRLGGMAVHLTDPANKVYILGMDGPLWEVDMTTLVATRLFDFVKKLDMPVSQEEQQHFKAAHSIGGKLWVASKHIRTSRFLRAAARRPTSLLGLPRTQLDNC